MSVPASDGTPLDIAQVAEIMGWTVKDDMWIICQDRTMLEMRVLCFSDILVLTAILDRTFGIQIDLPDPEVEKKIVQFRDTVLAKYDVIMDELE